MDLELELERHGRLLHRIARDLLGDATLAEDVVQETRLTALAEGRPCNSLEGHSWLRAVLINKTRQILRRQALEERGKERVAQASVTQATPDAELEKHELIELVGRALHSLAEPYRTTLIARYYEGLTASAIAARTKETASTVRTRIQRGLARLRSLLDEVNPERTWRRALLPFATLPGHGLRQASTAVLLGASLLLAGLVSLSVLSNTLPHEAPDPMPSELHLKPAANEIAEDSGGAITVRRQPRADREADSQRPGSSVPVQELWFKGLVLGRDGKRVPHAILLGKQGPSYRALTKTNVRGEFDIRVPYLGLESLIATAPGRAPSAPHRFDMQVPPPLPEPAYPTRLTFLLQGKGTQLFGIVRSEEGIPLAGITVRAGKAGNRGNRTLEDTSLAAPLQTTTNAQGEFAFEGLPLAGLEVFARSANHASTRAFVTGDRSQENPLELTLKPGYFVEGHVTNSFRKGDLDSIEIRSLRDPQTPATTANEDGSFRLGPLQAGKHELLARCPSGAEARTVIRGAAGDALTWDPILTHEHSVRGTLRDENGAPLYNHEIRVTNDSWPPFLSAARTDEEGRFAVPGVLRDTYLVTAWDPATAPLPLLVEGPHEFSTDRLALVLTTSPEKHASLTIDIEESAGQVGRQGVPLYLRRRRWNGWLHGLGMGIPLGHAGSGSSFEFKDLPPGNYEVVAAGARVGFATLDTFELRPGAQELSLSPPPSLTPTSFHAAQPGETIAHWLLERLDEPVRIASGDGAPYSENEFFPGLYRLEVTNANGQTRDVRFEIETGSVLQVAY